MEKGPASFSDDIREIQVEDTNLFCSNSFCCSLNPSISDERLTSLFVAFDVRCASGECDIFATTVRC